jgi:hypothetical protein
MTILLDAGVAIYVAMTTALIVWVGVFLFLLRIDHATQDVARQLNERTTARYEFFLVFLYQVRVELYELLTQILI